MTKLAIPIVLIVAGISWLAFSNLSEANYFYNVDELPERSDSVFDHSLKVKGRVVVGSIGKGTPVSFTIAENGQELNVVYVGDEPLPDMFKDRAEAVVEGTLRADGVFEAVHLQAKCASKYEAMPPEMGYEKGEYEAETQAQKADTI
jgi:cytochrome c-type biogenesis protein CcmE